MPCYLPILVSVILVLSILVSCLGLVFSACSSFFLPSSSYIESVLLVRTGSKWNCATGPIPINWSVWPDQWRMTRCGFFHIGSSCGGVMWCDIACARTAMTGSHELSAKGRKEIRRTGRTSREEGFCCGGWKDCPRRDPLWNEFVEVKGEPSPFGSLGLRITPGHCRRISIRSIWMRCFACPFVDFVPMSHRARFVNSRGLNTGPGSEGVEASSRCLNLVSN